MKIYYDSFDEYIKDFPEGESYRAWLTGFNSKGKSLIKGLKCPKSVLLIKGLGPHGGLPGGYLHAHKVQYVGVPGPRSWAIVVNDNDDASVVKSGLTTDECEETLKELKQLADCYLYDLCEFGFKYDN